MNLLEPLQLQATAHPERPALVAFGRTLTFGQVWDSIGAVAGHLRARGVRAGDCVAVSRLPPDAYLAVVLALARMGAVSSIVQGGWPAEKRVQLFARHRVKFWVGATDGAQDGVPTIDARLLLSAPPPGRAPEGLVTGLADQPWRIAMSSGTTGDSKSIPITHGRNALMLRNAMDIYPCGPGERLQVFADLGIGLAMGQTLMTLLSGGTVICVRNARPEDFFAVLDKARPTRALTTTALALSLVEHVNALPQEQRPQPGRLLSITLGGSTVTPALLEGVQSLICPNVIITYGSTEAGTIARADTLSLLEQPASAGRIVPWVQAQAVDAQDQPLPPGGHGLLRYRSPVIASRYLGDPAASAQSFRDGWYYPGDMGAIDEGGYLTLGARQDHLLNLQGVKVDPSRIEQLLNEQPGVAESAAIAVTMRSGRQVLVAVIVPKAGMHLETTGFGAMLRERLGSYHEPQRILQMESVPRNEAGKVVRRELAAQVMDQMNG